MYKFFNKNTLLNLLVFIAASCGEYNNGRINISKESPTKIDKNDNSKNEKALIKLNNNCKGVVINDYIARNIINIDTLNSTLNNNELSLIFKGNFLIQAEIKPNENDSYYTDTTYSVVADKSKVHFIDFYKGAYSIDKADINDNAVMLKNSIKIGMPLQAFKNLLKSRMNLCDTIIVTTSERTIDNKFVFEKGLLKSIKISVLAL